MRVCLCTLSCSLSLSHHRCVFVMCNLPSTLPMPSEWIFRTFLLSLWYWSIKGCGEYYPLILHVFCWLGSAEHRDGCCTNLQNFLSDIKVTEMLRHVSRWSTGALGNTLLNSHAHTWMHVHTLNSSTFSFHPLNLYVHSIRLDLSLCHSHSVRSTYHICLKSCVIYGNVSYPTLYNLFSVLFVFICLFCTDIEQ